MELVIMANANVLTDIMAMPVNTKQPQDRAIPVYLAPAFPYRPMQITLPIPIATTAAQALVRIMYGRVEELAASKGMSLFQPRPVVL